MKKTVWSLFLLFLFLSGLWAEGSHEDPNHITDYGRFTAVLLDIPAEVILEQGPRCRVEAFIPRKYIHDIEIYNDHGRLVIKPYGHINFGFFRSERIRFVITMPEWDELMITGSGSIYSEYNWHSRKAAATLTGSGDLDLQGVTADLLELKTTGSGRIGMGYADTDELSVKVTGSGSVSLEEAKTRYADLRISSSGRIQMDLNTRELISRITGSGDILCSGKTSCADIKTTGSGDFRGSGFLAEEADIAITGSGGISLKEDSRLREIRITGSGSYTSR